MNEGPERVSQNASPRELQDGASGQAHERPPGSNVGHGTLSPRMTRRPRGLSLLLLLAAIGLPTPRARGASFPPHLRFRTVSTERVTVIYHQGLEAMARQAASLATELLEAHEGRYGHRIGRLQIVLSDVEDEPNGFFTPPWMIEGLATYEETEHTAFGRGRNPDTRMVLRMAALEERFPKEDQAVFALDAWPGGLAPYLFGEPFLRFLTARSGEQALPDLARKQSGQVLPFLDDLTAHSVTGATFHAQWSLWAATVRSASEQEAEARRVQGLTASRPLTSRGVRQTAPRFCPDGQWIAYSSRTLTRLPAIRLVRPDGTEDHELVVRNGGSTLSWTPDGQGIVYAEAEVYDLFSTRHDLRVVDVATRRVRRITRGLRAHDPDVSPDGARIVFVRRMGDRSELFTIGVDGHGLTPLTASGPGTEWSSPRWRPQGDRIVAARLVPGGWLDVVLVDPPTGAVTLLTNDRAKDVEPTWTPDGRALVFRSDRDGVSNLYALRLEDGALRRLTNVLGGAFTPAVSPKGDALAFVDYSSRGYDVHLADLDLAAAVPAPPFVDPYPASPPAPAPVAVPDEPYRPWPGMLPRFWSPYWLSRNREEIGR